MRQKILYFFQFLLIQSVYSFSSILTPHFSSLLLGKMFRIFSPFLPANKIVKRNLEIVYPQKSTQWHQNLEKNIWENLGKTFGEFPHLSFFQKQTKIFGKEYLYVAQKAERPIIFVSAHFGNWELLPGILAQEGLAFSPVFRVPNNPYINHFLKKRRLNFLPYETPIFSKGSKDIKKILHHLKSGKHLGMLIDQKMNDGIKLRFLNQTSMTSSAAAALALKTNALIISGRMIRTSHGETVLSIDPPLDLSCFSSLPHFSAIQHCSQLLNDRIEKWILEKPYLWLWMHRRWDKSLYQHKSS